MTSTTFEFRGTVTCSESPCTYCSDQGRTVVVAHPSGPFLTYEAAIEHARVMARNVYGASTHRVGVERRRVGIWREVEA